jgi:hypothetical protein
MCGAGIYVPVFITLKVVKVLDSYYKKSFDLSIFSANLLARFFATIHFQQYLI